MRFQPVTAETLPGAKSPINSIFPHQGPRERLFFWAWERRGLRTVGLLVRIRRACLPGVSPPCSESARLAGHVVAVRQ